MTTQTFTPVSENQDGTITVKLDLQVYSLDAIKMAAYKFAKDCSLILNTIENVCSVNITFFDAQADLIAKKRLAGAFCNEVIDQELREKIAAQTEPMRNLILAQAFSKTNLLGDG